MWREIAQTVVKMASLLKRKYAPLRKSPITIKASDRNKISRSPNLVFGDELV